MKRKYTQRKAPSSKPKSKKSRFDLKVSKGLDLLLELPEENFNIREKNVLRRIQQILSDVLVGGGTLTKADYLNMQTIAKRHSVKLPK